MALGLAACTEKSHNPLSPNVAGPIAGVQITAPSLMEPINGVLVESGEPLVLKFGAATSNGERPFWYELQVAEDSEFSRLVHEADRVDPSAAPSGTQALAESGSLSYRVPAELDADGTYWWRARAVDGANVGTYSQSHAFEVFTPVTVGVPTPVSPIGGRVVSTRRPRFEAEVPDVEGPATGVKLEFEVARDPGFSSIAFRLTKSVDGDVVGRAAPSELAWNRTYYWRVRVTARGREGEVAGRWSRGSRFKTPPAPVVAPPPAPTPAPSNPSPAPAPSSGGGGFRPGGSRNAPFTTSGARAPNMLHIVEQVAREYPGALRNSCQSRGGSWEFMDRVVERLRAIDGRWGYNCKRGNCGDVSHDVVDYYRGQGNPNGSTNVQIIDIIGGHCSANPRPTWIDQTSATRAAGTIGRWKYPR